MGAFRFGTLVNRTIIAAGTGFIILGIVAIIMAHQQSYRRWIAAKEIGSWVVIDRFTAEDPDPTKKTHADWCPIYVIQNKERPQDKFFIPKANLRKLDIGEEVLVTTYKGIPFSIHENDARKDLFFRLEWTARHH